MTGEGSLANVAINLFTHYVVNESGKSVDDMLQFIKECLLKFMTAEEKDNFFRMTIQRFLFAPQKTISQKAVVQALSQLEIPATNLIQFLSEHLRIPTKPSADSNQSGAASLAENPVSLLCSTFVLTLKSLENIPAAKVDVGSIRAGTPIDAVTGEPEAVSTEGQALTYDEIIYVVFRTSFWICKNEQASFSEQEKIALLKLALSTLHALTKVTTPQIILDIIQDTDSVQTFLLELICLNDTVLLDIYMKMLKPPLDRFSAFIKSKEKDAKEGKDGKKEIIATPEDEQLKGIFVGIMKQSQQFLQKIFSWLIDSELGCLDQSVQQIPGVKKLLAKCAEDNDRWIRLLNDLIQSYLINVGQMKKLDDLKSPSPEESKEAKKGEEKSDPKAEESAPATGTDGEK